jgi:hypothetical protein
MVQRRVELLPMNKAMRHFRFYGRLPCPTLSAFISGKGGIPSKSGSTTLPKMLQGSWSPTLAAKIASRMGHGAFEREVHFSRNSPRRVKMLGTTIHAGDQE